MNLTIKEITGGGVKNQAGIEPLPVLLLDIDAIRNDHEFRNIYGGKYHQTFNFSILPLVRSPFDLSHSESNPNLIGAAPKSLFEKQFSNENTKRKDKSIWIGKVGTARYLDEHEFYRGWEIYGHTDEVIVERNIQDMNFEMT